MEVFVKMEGTRPGSDESDTLMLGRFAMVARDVHTGKARKVPQLIVETPEEKTLWDFGQEHKDHRVALAKRTLDKAPPDARESADLHDLMRAVRDSKDGNLDGEIMVPMAKTVNESVQLMFPQERNLHGKVFGGFLMRQAYELCFTTAATFAHTPLRFQSLDQIVFRLPVPIGAIVRLTSKVLKTTKPTDEVDGEAKAHIMVKAEVQDVKTGVGAPSRLS
jgi:acyl-coenzyme A thioesterase 9